MKRKLDKPVRCHVRFIVAGSTAKTVRRKLTLAQAVREIGGDPLMTEGRLMTGSPINKSRKIVRGVRVSLMYVADHRIRAEPCRVSVGLGDAREVIRAGVQV